MPPFKGKKGTSGFVLYDPSELSPYLNSETNLFRKQQPVIMYIGLCLINKPWVHTELSRWVVIATQLLGVATRVVPK